MAPLTRRRAGDCNAPTEMNVEYYRQRSSAGLIIAEAAQISKQAQGYPHTPGIYNRQQIEGWKKVTEAVHQNNGLIFLQLWHVGRVSHPDIQEDSKLPVAPSAVKANETVATYDGKKPMVTPHALNKEEISAVIEDYRQAAINSLEAGFDGVELHAANAYLIDQFLHNSSNKRKDEYGGSIENRSRFLFQVIEAILEIWENKKVGIRLSPSGIKYGMDDSNPVELFDYVVKQINAYELSYLHLLEPLSSVADHPKRLKQVTPHFRHIYKGTLITNGGFSKKTANKALSEGTADLIAFGRAFISNPDLPERFAIDYPLSDWDETTFYTRGPEGYVDYPLMNTSNKDQFSTNFKPKKT